MKFSYKNIGQKTNFSKGFPIWMATFVVVLGVTMTYAQTAHAGLFSFITDLISAGHVSADTSTSTGDSSSTNSQNMPLLQAVSNPNPTISSDCSDVSPVNGTILDPNISVSAIANCETTNTQISTYVVKSGDTISGVAQMFGVSINTVLWANSLTGKSVLQPGQTLVILPITGINYTVQKGDTLQGIANKYGGDHTKETLSDILNYNDMTVSTALTVGQTIIIPSAELSTNDITVSTPSRSTTKSSSAVRSGLPKNSLSSDEPLLDNVKNWPAYPSCNVASSGCYYLRPISGGHISQKLHGHNGVDLAAPIGTPIVASAGGTVIISRVNGGWNGGYGNFVVISHNNDTQTLYAHMQTKLVVSAGEHVKQGQVIGYIGMTGHTTGPHLHFEIRGAQNEFWNPNL